MVFTATVLTLSVLLYIAVNANKKTHATNIRCQTLEDHFYKIHEIYKIAANAKTLEQGLQISLENVSKYCNFSFGHVLKVRDEANRLTGSSFHIWHTSRQAFNENIRKLMEEEILESQIPQNVEVLKTDVTSIAHQTFAKIYKYKTMVRVPIKICGEVEFIFEFFSTDECSCVRSKYNSFLYYISDITSSIVDVVETKSAIHLAQKIAHDSKKDKNDFLVSLKHDILGNLQGIIGMVRLMQASPDLPPKLKKYIDLTYKSANAITATINSKTTTPPLPKEMSLESTNRHYPISKMFFGNDRNALPKFNVLLVEDTDVIRIYFEQLLTKMQVTFLSCDDGVRAIDLLNNNNFDLVLLDCHLPKLSGYDVALYIRKELDTHHKTLPIVAITGYGFEEDVEKLFRIGINDVINKPVQDEEFDDKVRRWLNVSLTSLQNTSEIDAHFNINPFGSGSRYDFSLLNKMCMRGDEAERYKVFSEVIEAFLKNTPQKVQDLKEAYAQNDVDTIWRRCHTIRTSAELFGAKKLSNICLEVEESGRKKILPHKKLFDEVIDEFSDLAEYLKNISQLPQNHSQTIH